MGSFILSTLEKCVYETLDAQGGETACSETTALLGGEGEPLCTEHFCSALHCCWSQETAKGREKNCTW